MKTGDIILIPFPFSDLNRAKVRPCVVICLTSDKYKDVVVSAISSVLPKKLNRNDLRVEPDQQNNLRTSSVIKVDRIVTVRNSEVIAKLGKLKRSNLESFLETFRNLVN